MEVFILNSYKEDLNEYADINSYVFSTEEKAVKAYKKKLKQMKEKLVSEYGYKDEEEMFNDNNNYINELYSITEMLVNDTNYNIYFYKQEVDNIDD